MSFTISLLDFWRAQHRAAGTQCIIRPFHRKIALTLTKLMLGKLEKPNLMILMPPRCAKTSLVVRAFVPWAMSYFPDSEFILSSYGQDLATDNNVSVRDTLSAEWYRGLVGSDWGADIEMRGDKAGGRQDHFFTTAGGSCKAVGVGGGIIGFGAGKLRPEFGGAIIMDDMLKPVEAKSPTSRRAAIDTIRNTLESRRNRKTTPMTPMILVMQRLGPQDPAGYFLQNERERWTIVQVPAEDGGESIWPERISLEELAHMKESDPDTYWAQMMQEPSQSARAIFREAWWKYWIDRDALERRITLKFITADTAFKATDSADYSVIQCWGCIGTSGLVLTDQVRGQWEFPELVEQAKAFVAKNSARRQGFTPATEFWVEDKASGTSLVQTFQRAGIPVNAWVPGGGAQTATGVRDPSAARDKVGRAKQCTMPISAGRLFLPDPKLPGYKWVEGFINEHSSFTDDDSHLHDDVVDAQTMATLIWLQRGGGTGPLPEPLL